jgi:hypothetical protein
MGESLTGSVRQSTVLTGWSTWRASERQVANHRHDRYNRG